MDRLKAIIALTGSPLWIEFTFQYGQIKSCVPSALKSLSCRFTFQYGQIKRHEQNKPVRSRQGFTFQYGQIKSPCGLCPRCLIVDLHSSMDRLKDRQYRGCYLWQIHLHSSMDRLKALQVSSILFFCGIYIPVWID